MAGGHWETQNKRQPGIYIRFSSKEVLRTIMGERGTIAISRNLSWGPEGEIIRVENLKDLEKLTGISTSGDDGKAFAYMSSGTNRTRGAHKFLVYRQKTSAGTSKKAFAEIENDGVGVVGRVQAKYSGEYGNNLLFKVTPVLLSAEDRQRFVNYDNENPIRRYHDIAVFLNGDSVFSQRYGVVEKDSDSEKLSIDNTGLSGFAKLVESSGYVELTNDTGDGEFVAPESLAFLNTTNRQLAGGEDGIVNGFDIEGWTNALEEENPDVVVVDFDNDDHMELTTPDMGSTRSRMASFVKRMQYENGKYYQLVTFRYASADSEQVISLANGFKTATGEVVPAHEACLWLAGAEAGVPFNKSLTRASCPFAAEPVPKYRSYEIDYELDRGQVILSREWGRVGIVSDINTLTSLTPERTESFKKNRVIRTLYAIANDLSNNLARNYIGVLDVDETGRSIIKTSVYSYLKEIEGKRGITELEINDVEVLQGETKDAVVVNILVKPVDSLEKIYMSITIV